MPSTAGPKHLPGDSPHLAVAERRLRFETWAADEVYMTSPSHPYRIDRHHRHLRYPYHSDEQIDCSRHSRPLPRLLLILDVSVDPRRLIQYFVWDVYELACRANILDSRRDAMRILGHLDNPDDAVPVNARRGLQAVGWDDNVFDDGGEHRYEVSLGPHIIWRLTFSRRIWYSLCTEKVYHLRLLSQE